MNPGDYPLNGSPFHVPPSYAQQQHHQQQQQPQQHAPGQGSPGTPVESGSPHAMQHSPFPYTTFTYPTHSYPQYPQYPQPIMMYGHPRAQPHHTTQAGPSTNPSTSSTKLTPTSAKRKSLPPAPAHPIHVQLTTSLPPGSGHDTGAATASDNKKRTKTQRACDSCRSRKIRQVLPVPFIDSRLSFFSRSRCDILPDSDPPVCQHCKQSLFECTFFLPITETRFKKKKAEDEAQAPEREGGRGTASPIIDSQKGETRVFGAPPSLTTSVSLF